MKVKDLIRDTVWIPGSGYSEDHKPAISVLLPTFRRGTSGLFRKAVESILNQTLRDIELIIVDDASTDGTADQIAEFMARDGRVSCLRHPHNIGLPAVSEFEAFLNARADYIAFAFDDDFFYPDALEKLLEHSLNNPGRVCFGSVTWRAREKGSTVIQSGRLGFALTYHNIRSWNTIPNCALLLQRVVIDDVGFYDPHILMTRICDWDLWRRIGARYLLHHVDVEVGEVTGPETDDSLGKTYGLYSDAAEEWMRGSHRVLTVSEYLDLDVFSSGADLSDLTNLTIRDLAAAHAAKRPLLFGGASTKDSSVNKQIIVLTTSHDASTSLCFDYLPLQVRGKFRVILSHGGFSISELAHASCVIVVRLLDAHTDWIRAARTLNIPVYYFLDDNLTELVASEKFVATEDFSIRSLRTKLRDFAGCLLSTNQLVSYFEANLIHPNLYMFPVSYAVTPPKFVGQSREADRDLVVASIGGKHRQRGLIDHVLPGLQQLALDGVRIHFVIAGAFPADYNDLLEEVSAYSALKVTLLPFDVDIGRAQMQLAEYRPDLLLHAPNSTVNSKYKTLNVALSAYILDCVLIVPNEPPYDMREFDGAAVRVEAANEPRAWLRTLQRLLSNRETWEGYKKANAAFCRAQFSGEQNLIVLNEILGTAPAITPALVESRLKELYLSKVVSAGSDVPDSESLQASLLQLSQIRTRTRRNQRYRPHRPREDIWPRVSPAFEDIRQYVLKNKIRSNSSFLELSNSLHDVAYAEYPVHLKQGRLKDLTCALSSEGIHDGTVGVELVAPDGTISLQSSKDLAPLSLNLPVTFDLRNTVVPQDGTWRVRFFTRSTWPVYVLEFAEYASFGWRRRVIAPFMKIEYAC